MNDLQFFYFESNPVRTILINDEPYCIGKDIAKILGYSNPRDALRRHVDSEDKEVVKLDTLGGMQNQLVINESGMYSLILKSQLKEAKRFKRWVTSEVLPTVRKTGSFSIKNLDIPDQIEDIMIYQLQELKIVKKDIATLKTETTLTSSQKRQINGKVNSIVIHALGGQKTPAYRDKSIRHKCFSNCYKQLKDYFDVSSYMDIPKIRFEEALEIIPGWTPPLELQARINSANVPAFAE